ncbi:hypothetical protein Lal_00047792 [Lupinus albus]|uniref:Uncharacterized protein n=1 Tax=Lupinus albus TaxID=3870 RepID=A0A6A4R033_LUPAL|nr:hypothetical protein Lalb_Chr02g0145301 [Lupinus albus]KAF1879120.1 hypothetical protein Lal_00047792 [Lupinus albus]
MDTKLKFVVTFVTLTLASFFATLLSVSEARPFPCKDGIIREVDGVFRTLKSSSASPDVGDGHKKLQNFGGMKDSGPTPGVGHGIKTLQVNGPVNSGPSPGEGHNYNINNHS